MGNVPHYPWYPDDYLSSPWVTTCTLKEEGIYRRLLDYQWKHDGCQLPDDMQYLRRLLKLDARTAQIQRVLDANFTRLRLNGDTVVWRNERLYVEFCKALAKSESARNAVKLRKIRPIKQSDDSRSIEQNNSTGVSSGQSSDNPPEVNPEVKVEPEVVKTKSKELCPDALRLSGLMAELILQHTPDHRDLNNGRKEKTVSRWAEDIDKMIRIDKRTVEGIEKIIIFTHTDAFWFKNVLSGETLRKKYDQLGMNMKQSGRQKNDKHSGIDSWLQETYYAKQ